MSKLDKVAPYYKAVAGVAVPALTALAFAKGAESDAGTVISGAEWLSAAVAGFVGGNAVFWTPNKDRLALHQDESVQPPRA